MHTPYQNDNNGTDNIRLYALTQCQSWLNVRLLRLRHQPHIQPALAQRVVFSRTLCTCMPRHTCKADRGGVIPVKTRTLLVELHE